MRFSIQRSPAVHPLARGFTIVELAVVLSLFSGVSSILYMAFATQSGTITRESGNTVTQNEMRSAMERLVREIQQASYDPTGSGQFGFSELDAEAIRFSLDGNGDGVLQAGIGENRAFRLAGGTLQAQSGNASWRPLVSGVQRLLFEYLDARGLPTTSDPAIRRVRITLTARSEGRSPTMAPADKTLTAIAYLRNR